MPKGKGYSSPIGMYSNKSNPMKQANKVSNMFGPSGNSDAQKANKLLQKAHAKHESLRGKSGM